MSTNADIPGVPALAHVVPKQDDDDAPVQYPTHWYRNTYTQAIILGLVSFCSPGAWNAMANLGAGGLQSAATGNAANSVTFGLMVFTCLIGPSLLGKFGTRYTLVIGTLGYAPYAAGLYCNSKFGNQWLVIFGAATCGLTAGIFWAAEGAAIIAYPEPSRRGRAIAIWFSISTFGSVIGGAINLALNVTGNKIGGVSVNTYAVFIAIQCVSPLFAILLSNPEQVQRTDGLKPKMPSNDHGFWQELVQVVSLWKQPRNWVYAIPFFMSKWGSGSTSYYLANYFTVRVRALNTLVGALLTQIVIWAFGYFMDSTRISIRVRAYGAAGSLAALLGAAWIWFFVNQYDYHYAAHKPAFDWDTPGFAAAWVPVLLISLLTSILGNWLYWVIAHMATGQERGRQIATLRSVESLSSCIAYGIGASHLPVINVAAVNLAVYAVSLYPLYLLVKYISDREADGRNAPIEELAVAEKAPSTTGSEDEKAKSVI